MAGRILNIGFVGNGKSANRYHIPFVLTRPEKFRIKSVYGRHLGGSEWPRLEGVRYTSDLDEVLGDPEIDLVVICTMHDTHRDYALRALDAGKNILVEKPFAMTLAEAREVFDRGREKGLLVVANQNRRYDSDFLTLKKVIASGKLGDVYEIVQHFDYWRPEVPRGAQGYSARDSFVYGHAAHTVDQAVSLYGAPRSVRYDVRQLLGAGHMNDYYDIDLEYDGLRYSLRSSYFRAIPRPSFVAYGTKGTFVKQRPDRQEEHLKLFYMPGEPGFGEDRPEDFGTVAYYDDEGAYHEEKVPSVTGDYARVYDDVYDALVSGAEPSIRPEHTLEVMRILEEAVSGLS